MSLTFENNWPLVLLGVIPWLWWVRGRSMVGLGAKQLTVSTCLRTGLIAAIVLALMQPSALQKSTRISTVYLLDISASVSPAAVQEGLAWIRNLDQSGGAAHSKFLAFASNSMAFDSVADLANVQVASQPQPGAIDQTHTRLSAALDRAVQSFAPDHLKRLVLLSDGNSNSGDLTAALDRLRREKVRAYTRPLNTRASRDTWIEAMLAPASVTAEEQFPVEVHVFSQIATPAEIELKNGARTLEKRAVALKEGLNRIAFKTNVKDERSTAVLQARVTVPGDPIQSNNVFIKSTAVIGKPHILYVEGYAPSAHYLRDALTLEGLQVEVATAAQMPATAEKLDAYDAVVISDVDRHNLSQSQMEAVATYVRDLGGGFLMIGGENTYGKEGYTKSTIEEILPITFETDKRQSLAMVVVLDRSASMAGSKMDLAKEATKAPLELLKADDYFGVLTFNHNFQWAQKVVPVKNKDEIRDMISRIVATGNTNIYPALSEAYEEIMKTPAETKHIILLSDGQTPAEDFKGLATKMARNKVTLSTIALTTVSDRVLLEKIANWGGGRAYYVETAENVPQIFQDETQLAVGKSLHEESFRPVVQKMVEAFKGIDFGAAPELMGYVATKPKATSEVLLQTGAHKPLLARWQYALGKTAMFTSDAKDRWAVEWLKWKGYTKFWAQILRETMRHQDNDQFDFQVEREGDEAHITINAVGKDDQFRNALHPQVRVLNPSQAASTVDVPQVGPGSYETRVPLRQDGSYVFRAMGDVTGAPSRSVDYSYPDEYHFYPPDFTRLKTISAETGGVYQPSGAEIFDPHGETITVRTELWPLLASLALAVYLGDMLLRRLRLFA